MILAISLRRDPKDLINTRILQPLVSGMPDVLGLRTSM